MLIYVDHECFFPCCEIVFGGALISGVFKDSVGVRRADIHGNTATFKNLRGTELMNGN